MKTMKNKIDRFIRDESGAVAIEYSLIAGAMFLAISPAFYLVRDAINVKFAAIASYFTTI